MQHNSFITSTNLRQHVVANKPTNKYKRCMSSHKTILCHRVFFFWPNPKYFSADYPAASVRCGFIENSSAVSRVTLMPQISHSPNTVFYKPNTSNFFQNIKLLCHISERKTSHRMPSPPSQWSRDLHDVSHRDKGPWGLGKEDHGRLRECQHSQHDNKLEERTRLLRHHPSLPSASDWFPESGSWWCVWKQQSGFHSGGAAARDPCAAGPPRHGGVRAAGQAEHPDLSVPVLPGPHLQHPGQELRVLQCHLEPSEDWQDQDRGRGELRLVRAPRLHPGAAQRGGQTVSPDVLQVRALRGAVDTCELLRDGDRTVLLRGMLML